MELVIPTSSESSNNRNATDVLEHPRKSTYSKESSFDDFARDLDWYTANENLMLDELSKLCRDLHAKLNNFSNFDDFDSLGSSSDQLFGTSKRSCSTEDIANLLGEEAEREEDSNFERSCKTRRSLPAEVKYRFRKNNPTEKQGTLERKSKSGDQSLSQALEEKFDQDKPEETPEKSKSEKEENRPSKKVGFSKTEIHFAPDTGKVNIVETDGKPPPTNRFRRRRRNHIKNSKHFPVGRTFSAGSADGAFEKYFFGGLLNPDLKRNKETEQQVNQQTAHSETSEKKRDELKNRGHITTINFITDDTNEPTRSAQVDGNGPTENSSSGDQKDSLVTRTTKMTVHIPFTNPEIPHLKNFPLSSLKSVRLILNVNPVVENRKLEDLYSLFYEQSESKSTVQDDEEKINETSSSSKASQFKTEKKSDSELLEKMRNCKVKILEEVSPLQSLIMKQEKRHENVLLPDEKNVVSTNVVRLHKPVVSNVEKDYNLKRLGKKSKVLEQPARRLAKNSADEKTWTKNNEMSTYVNAFNGPRGKDELYENVFDMKTTQSKKKVDHLHRTSQKEENSKKKENSSRSKSSLKNIAKASKTSEKNVKDIKNAGKSLETANFPVVVTKRLNQPKEFIHKTAVFNMPNETLTKSAKLKQNLRRHK